MTADSEEVDLFTSLKPPIRKDSNPIKIRGEKMHQKKKQKTKSY